MLDSKSQPDIMELPHSEVAGDALATYSILRRGERPGSPSTKLPPQNCPSPSFGGLKIMEKCNRCEKEAHHTHHKDYNHKNNKPENLEKLCTLCHSKEHNTEPNLSELRVVVSQYKASQKVKNQIGQARQSLLRIEVSPDEKFSEMERTARLQEYHYERQIKKLLEDNDLAVWMTSIHGIGYTMAGLILSEIDWSKIRTEASLWSYSGLAPNQKKVAGVKASWNHRLKTYCHQLVDCFIKARTPKYRDIYDKEKAKQLGRELKKGHAHNRAIRKTAKVFLRDLFIEARRIDQHHQV